MFATSFDSEEKQFKNKKTAIALTLTIAIHVGLLLILLFTLLHTPIPPFEDNAGGMSVNFGTDETGHGDEQPFTYNPGPAEAKATAPAQAQPEATTPDNLLTQDNEESEVTAPKTEDKPKPKINKEAVFKPTPAKPVTTTSTNTKPAKVENAVPQPKADPNAMFSKGAYGKPNNSSGDGTGGPQGDQGKPNGDPNSRNYQGDGDGNGTGHGKGDLGGGYSLHGRSRLVLPAPTQCNSEGRVIISIKENQEGKVIDARFVRAGSSTNDDCNVGNALIAARKATFNPDPKAPDVQEGTITYIYKVH